MARAKNTSRAEARKRTRDLERADLAENEQLDDQGQTDTAAAPAARKPLFQMPNVREDIQALPGLFRTKRLLWLPFALVLAGFFIALVLGGMPGNIQGYLSLYLQFFFSPQGLFVFFIAGFVAPRASWLVGLLVGALTGLLWLVVTVWVGLAVTGDGMGYLPESLRLSFGVNELIQSLVFGTLAAGFAAWYRNFLKNMQKGGEQRRAAKASDDLKARAKRRDDRQEARKVAKQRPS